MTRTDEIKARLDAVTPKHWEMEMFGELAEIWAGGYKVADAIHPIDADFIANAPDDTAYLLAQNTELQAENERLRGLIYDKDQTIEFAKETTESFRAALAKAEAERDAAIARICRDCPVLCRKEACNLYKYRGAEE